MTTHTPPDISTIAMSLATLPFTSVIAFLIAGNGDSVPFPANIDLNVHLHGRLSRADSDTVIATMAQRYGVRPYQAHDYEVLKVEVPVNGCTVRLNVFGTHREA